MHKQSILLKREFLKNLKFPNSEYLSKNGFYLPSGLALTNTEIDIICEKVNKIIC